VGVRGDGRVRLKGGAMPWWTIAEAETEEPYAAGFHTNVEALVHAKHLLAQGYRTVLVFDATSLKRFWAERPRRTPCPVE
jgi:hypothetical protein